MSYQDLTNQVQNLVETNSALVTEVSRVRDSAMGLLRLYPTITAGREASAIGQYFSVPGNGAFVRLYQKTSASQQDLIAEYPTIDVFEGALTQAQQDADRSTTEADRSTTEANRSRDEADRAYQEYLNAQNVVVTNGTILFDLDVATSVQPTLSSNFSRNKHERYELYGNEPKTLLQQWDINRNSTATYIDANGVLQTAAVNQPRIDYSTGEGRLLVEGQSTNLLLWSEDFGNSYWGKSNATIQNNVAVAPDGTLSGDGVYATTTNTPVVQRLGIITPGEKAFSIFAKSGSSSVLTLNRDGGYNPASVFDLNLGVVISGEGYATIHPVGNGWYWCTHIDNADITSSIYISFANTEIGDFAYIWGVQIEVGNKPTSYIKTEASQVTRLADIITPKGDA